MPQAGGTRSEGGITAATPAPTPPLLPSPPAQVAAFKAAPARPYVRTAPPAPDSAAAPGGRGVCRGFGDRPIGQEPRRDPRSRSGDRSPSAHSQASYSSERFASVREGARNRHTAAAPPDPAWSQAPGASWETPQESGRPPSEPQTSPVLAPTPKLSGALLAVVRALCAAADGSAAAGAGGGAERLPPRGLVNTGNLCFMNSILQALMGSAPFCQLLGQLRAAAPALANCLPTLHALAQLAAELQPAERRNGGASRAAEDAGDADAGGEASRASSDSGRSDGGAAAAGAKKRPKNGGGSVAAAASAPAPKSAWGRPDSQVQGATWAALLGGHALLPDMMFPTVNRFNPANGPLLASPKGKGGDKARTAAAAVAARREQEDAADFLHFLLDQVHEELLQLSKAHAEQLDAAAGEPGEDAAGADDQWLVAGRKKKKAVMRGSTFMQGGESRSSAIFAGALISEVKAAGVPASATFEAFIELQLAIDSDQVFSVADAFARMSKAETLHDYKVRDDSAKGRASKCVQLYRLPRVLVLHLKRFTHGLGAGTGKLHKPVRFDATLHIQPGWVHRDCPQHAGAALDLIATVSHHGRTPASGHYTADVRQEDGRWLRFDDSNVTSVPLSRVLDDKAYLLFYQLRG
ncbi:hypothetical protein WJX81_004670 [Elliptochloris bilobata]|uniref:ubiquitinyl hydrolase 1 n=1 Tax=Elliptochloris bilobata TaxID=381761 RepID=A0AAW1S3F1_9CHLO